MDIFEIRQANLNALVDSLTTGGRLHKHAALDLGLSASYLSQLIGGKKMGDDVARKIEKHMRLDRGWMDREHNNVREPTTNYQPLRIDPPTIAAAVTLVRHAFAYLDAEFDNEQDGVPLAFAYEFLFKRGERGVTPDNLIDFSKRLKRLRGEDEDEARAGDTRSTGGGYRRTRKGHAAN